MVGLRILVTPYFILGSSVSFCILDVLYVPVVVKTNAVHSNLPFITLACLSEARTPQRLQLVSPFAIALARTN